MYMANNNPGKRNNRGIKGRNNRRHPLIPKKPTLSNNHQDQYLVSCGNHGLSVSFKVAGSSEDPEFLSLGTTEKAAFEIINKGYPQHRKNQDIIAAVISEFPQNKTDKDVVIDANKLGMIVSRALRPTTPTPPTVSRKDHPLSM